MRGSLEERFLAKLDKNGPIPSHKPELGPCWVWTAVRHEFGYGLINLCDAKQKIERAHRVAWILAHGSIPDGMDVCHRCDNPPCARLSHLFLGDATINLRDASAKGRTASGERHGMVKLTTNAVIQIRYMFFTEGRTQEQIAKIFNITRSGIAMIIQRRNWKNI